MEWWKRTVPRPQRGVVEMPARAGLCDRYARRPARAARGTKEMTCRRIRQGCIISLVGLDFNSSGERAVHASGEQSAFRLQR